MNLFELFDNTENSLFKNTTLILVNQSLLLLYFLHLEYLKLEEKNEKTNQLKNVVLILFNLFLYIYLFFNFPNRLVDQYLYSYYIFHLEYFKLEEKTRGTEEEIRLGVRGNVARCHSKLVGGRSCWRVAPRARGRFRARGADAAARRPPGGRERERSRLRGHGGWGGRAGPRVAAATCVTSHTDPAGRRIPRREGPGGASGSRGGPAHGGSAFLLGCFSINFIAGLIVSF